MEQPVSSSPLFARLSASVPVLLALAWGATQASAAPADGKTLFVQRCSGCHENAATGAPGRAVIAQQTPAMIIQTLSVGVMKPQGTGLTATDVAAIADYLSVHKAPLVKRTPARSTASAAKSVKKR